METLRARRPDAAIGSFNGLSSHMGRILAIDYGRKRTGLAVTDPLQIIANALDTVPTHTLMDYVKSYAAANAVDAIVDFPKDTAMTSILQSFDTIRS